MGRRFLKLSIAKVGDILSYRALSAPQLQKVSGPAQQLDRSALLQMFSPTVWLCVYKIRDPLPRLCGVGY